MQDSEAAYREARDRGLRVNPFAYAWKDIRQFQNEMTAAGHAHECLWLVRQSEEPPRRVCRNDAVVLSVNHKNRDAHVADREIRTEPIKHQPAHGKKWVAERFIWLLPMPLLPKLSD